MRRNHGRAPLAAFAAGVALAALAALLGPAPARAAMPAVLLLATHDQRPYSFPTPQGDIDGLSVRTMRCALDRIGQRHEFHLMPWARAQAEANAGRMHGFFPATLTDERQQVAVASAVVSEQDWVWYLPKDSPLDPRSASFRETARVGAHLGSNRLAFLKSRGYNVVVSPMTENDLIEAFVKGKRADAVLAGSLAARESFAQLGLDESAYRVVIERSNPLHAYFGKAVVAQDPSFMGRFNAALVGCQARR